MSLPITLAAAGSTILGIVGDSAGGTTGFIATAMIAGIVGELVVTNQKFGTHRMIRRITGGAFIGALAGVVAKTIVVTTMPIAIGNVLGGALGGFMGFLGGMGAGEDLKQRLT